MYSQSPKAKRIEFRCPDPTCNPYLAFAAITMAAIDGIQLKLSPGQAVEKDIPTLPPEELAEIRKTPATLDEALTALGARLRFPTQRGRLHLRRDRHLDRPQAASTRSMPSASARIRMSFACTLMRKRCRPGLLASCMRLPTFAGGEKCLH